MARFTHTFRCTADASRAANGRHVQCTRRVTGFSDDSAHHAEQAATDAAVLRDWAPRGGDWSLASLRGLTCAHHSGQGR